MIGAVYLGGTKFGQLKRAGLVEELKPDAAWRADGMFRTEQIPRCLESF
ncbi:MAG: hypothetical protein M3391_01875 [Actinomycetota bacterium]|nr:hypothetical protein [Actinomycetota bacterium]